MPQQVCAQIQPLPMEPHAVTTTSAPSAKPAKPELVAHHNRLIATTAMTAPPTRAIRKTAVYTPMGNANPSFPEEAAAIAQQLLDRATTTVCPRGPSAAYSHSSDWADAAANEPPRNRVEYSRQTRTVRAVRFGAPTRLFAFPAKKPTPHTEITVQTATTLCNVAVPPNR
jgi:hypothetical protein